jgi:hypothetical protein
VPFEDSWAAPELDKHAKNRPQSNSLALRLRSSKIVGERDIIRATETIGTKREEVEELLGQRVPRAEKGHKTRKTKAKGCHCGEYQQHCSEGNSLSTIKKSGGNSPGFLYSYICST